jgi:uncharacterized protein (TIGR03118 family)
MAVGGLAAALVALVGSSALASSSHHHPSGSPTSGFKQINQVSDQPGVAKLTDPDLVNPWGLALAATSPLWSANNGTNTATLYAGGLSGAAVTKVALTVSIPGGAPTGEVANDTTDFVVSGPGGSGPANFIFASEGGDITAWNKTANGTTAVLVAHVPGAIFKGLTLVHAASGPVLLATDFHNGRIDAFDGTFHQIALPPKSFRDKHLPKGYAPFNVLADDDRILVTYAKQDADREDDVAGAGFGFVNEFTDNGRTVHRIASRGTLNAPWGLAIAPDGFGKLGGSLLVGNFGDGRINVFRHDHFAGQLSDNHNHRIVIDGLWSLLPGTATTGGVDTLWFSAGPDDETHGLVGQLEQAY